MVVGRGKRGCRALAHFARSAPPLPTAVPLRALHFSPCFASRRSTAEWSWQVGFARLMGQARAAVGPSCIGAAVRAEDRVLV
ncbi:hypothetical protein AAHA92_05960 [Salvia divinorum]|uniref:Uncharacterized protein n=1 Tax=Salvia divinorum TaxID=28513 RepID=A0ABD1I7M7_SALDI